MKWSINHLKVIEKKNKKRKVMKINKKSLLMGVVQIKENLLMNH